MHWLLQLCRGSADGADAVVREILAQAIETRARVELLPSLRGTGDERPFVTTVEELGEEGMVVAMPSLGGAARPLGRFESYRMTITHAQKAWTGSTGSLGRMRYRSISGAMQPGYRLTYPEVLEPIDRRREMRLVLGADTLREASLQVAHRNGPIFGIVEDISARGLRLRCRNAASDLAEGTEGHVRLELSSAIGSIAEMVRVVGLDTDGKTGDTVVRAVFLQPVEAINRVLDGGCSALRRSGERRRPGSE